MKFLKKLGAIMLNVLASLILLVLLAWTGLMIAKFVIYNDYMTNRQKEAPIPALNDGFVPQGLACTEDGLYIHSGYNGKAMEMHLVQNGEAKQILPLFRNFELSVMMATFRAMEMELRSRRERSGSVV